MDGLDRSIEGTDRLIEGLGRLLIDGPGLGETGLDRVVIRFCKLLRGALGMGADGIARDGLRLICGLGADRNDRELIAAPRFITCGCDRICGAGDVRGATLWVFCREAAPLGAVRVRD